MKVKLLVVADDFVAGGAFVVGERLARGLTDAYSVIFACDLSPVNRAARLGLAEAGAMVVQLFASAGETRRATYDIGGACTLLQRAKPDKVLFVDSSPRSNLAVKNAARKAGVPYVAIINFVDRETPAALKIFDGDVERTANAAAALVFVSAAARAEFDANFPGVTAPRLVVANGVPDEFFRAGEPTTRAAARRALGVADDEVMLLLPGRLEPRKGQDLALDALAALVAGGDGPTLRLVLAGFGDAEAKAGLQKRIHALNLESYVRYLGPRDDVPRLLDACDIVLMPSAQEADGLVSKEAMAKGRPVVASDLPGVREQGHDEAFLVPAPGDGSEKTVKALVAVVDILRRDPGRREHVGGALRAIAERRFTLAQMLEAYREILAASPVRRSSRPPKSNAAVPVGRWIPASKPHEAGPLFKDGWSEFEPEGIWSLGLRSRIAFALRRPAARIDVACRAFALATPERTCRFDVIANGRKVATWDFAQGEFETKTVRIALPFPKRVCVLRLCRAQAVSPFDLGLNDDRRPLGLFVSSLRIVTGTGVLRLWAGLTDTVRLAAARPILSRP